MEDVCSSTARLSHLETFGNESGAPIGIDIDMVESVRVQQWNIDNDAHLRCRGWRGRPDYGKPGRSRRIIRQYSHQWETAEPAISPWTLGQLSLTDFAEMGSLNSVLALVSAGNVTVSSI